MSKLKELRNAKGYSQNQLVSASGVSRSLICKYESGEKNINHAAASTLQKIAIALDCKIEDLLESS